ncbi:MAG: TetR/AcrR family transcriptional regulator [Acidimicrobiales bacterium]
MTQDRILEASVRELDEYGVTSYRVKRVAERARVSVSLLYVYFEDREALVAESVVARYRRSVVPAAAHFARPLRAVATRDELRRALFELIDQSQRPEHAHAHRVRLECLAFAQHNARAAAGIEAAKHEAGAIVVGAVQPLVDHGLTSPGLDAVGFVRLWYALFFGQVSLAGEGHPLAQSTVAWSRSLRTLVDVVAPPELSLA